MYRSLGLCFDPALGAFNRIHLNNEGSAYGLPGELLQVVQVGGVGVAGLGRGGQVDEGDGRLRALGPDELVRLRQILLRDIRLRLLPYTRKKQFKDTEFL
jgi:hypothetical protein